MPSQVTVRRGYFPESDLRRFLEKAHDELELLWWLLMCDGGLRVGEVRRLHFSDLEGRSVRVRGKGRKVRLVPVTSRVSRVAALVMGKYRFSEADKVCGVSGRSVQRRFDAALTRAGLKKEKLCPHSLRHTFATRLLVAGVDIHRVGVLLGHASTQTTVGYLHTNEDSLRDARDRLEAINKNSPPPGAQVGEAQEGGSPVTEAATVSPPSTGYEEIEALVSPEGEAEGGAPQVTPPCRPSPIENLGHLL